MPFKSKKSIFKKSVYVTVFNPSGKKMVPLDKNKQTNIFFVCFCLMGQFFSPENKIIIVFMYDFSDDDTLEAVQERSKNVLSFLRFSPKRSKNEHISIGLLFLSLSILYTLPKF